MRLLIATLLSLAPLIADAQQDPMEAQRCVWRCLSAYPGANNPAYLECTRTQCGFEEPGQNHAPQVATGVPIASAWHAGVASNGVHQFAGTDAEQGYGFYYFCTPAESFFSLVALPMAPGQFRFVIGDTAYLVPFDRTRGDLSVNIPPGAPFLLAVQAGTWLRIEALDGTLLIQFSLSGAAAGINQALTACFS